MKKYLIILISILIFISCDQTKKAEDSVTVLSKSNYLQNRTPLQIKTYLELPLGAIKPEGWLLDQLKRMKTGLTGNFR